LQSPADRHAFIRGKPVAKDERSQPMNELFDHEPQHLPAVLVVRERKPEGLSYDH
jgi:hypothetical protein